MRTTAYEFPQWSRAAVCGILNVTPDSFSDGGAYLDADKALEHAREMVMQGADMIDIGAQSTRPGSVRISEKEELSRIAPVLEALGDDFPIPLSIDTFYPNVARYALSRGVSVINDVSGSLNPEMAALAVKYGAGIVVMHSGGANGDDILKSVGDFFIVMLLKSVSLGIDRPSLCLDPGFGFGKNTAENLRLLMNLSEIKLTAVALMVGLSRKRFIGELCGEDDPLKRDPATAIANAAAVCGGANILRVHDVAGTLKAVRAASKREESNG